MKRILTYIFIIFLFVQPAFSHENTKVIGQLQDELSTETIGKSIPLTLTTSWEIDEKTNISQGSIINIYIENSSKEKRFHRSGFFIGKLLNYSDPITKETTNIEEKNILVVGRKYDEINASDVAKTGTEFTATTIVGFLVPGSDIVYYFTKGAIKNETGTRFKSGVHCAYDNSIFWLILKGKPINLQKGDYVILKSPKKSELKLLDEVVEE